MTTTQDKIMKVEYTEAKTPYVKKIFSQFLSQKLGYQAYVQFF